MEWTATARANATPCEVLRVLTHPESIRRWSPVDFDLDELSGRRLAAGTRGRVTGRVAGVTVGFDLEVHAADEARLELSAEGPVAFDVRYELMPHEAGSSLNASVTVRRGGASPGAWSRRPAPRCCPLARSRVLPAGSPAWRSRSQPRRRLQAAGLA